MKHNINEETTYFTIKTYSSEMLVETNQHDPEDAPIASAYDEALSNLHDTNYRLYTKNQVNFILQTKSDFQVISTQKRPNRKCSRLFKVYLSIKQKLKFLLDLKL